MKTKLPTATKIKLETNFLKQMSYALLLFSGMAFGQIVNIPDANFKAKLLASLPSNTIGGNLSGTFFKIDSNSDGQIQVSEALQVGYIDVSSSNIIDMTGIEAFTGLKTLICNNNQILNLNLSAFTNLQVLRCHNNQISNLDIVGLTNLKQLKCNYNLLTSLNASNLIHVFVLECSYNQISSLNISGLINLDQLDCQGNQLTNLNLNGLNSLRFIYCGGNQLSNLDLTGLSILQELYCNYNQIQILDVNSFLNLDKIYCNNNQLTSLCIKNGRTESILNFSNNPNLMFICADEQQVVSIQNQINTLGMTATVSNTYCSFTPGGNYNTITGTMIFDANNNGCDINDLPQPNIRVNINDGTNIGGTFTNNQGVYNFYTQTGSFELTPDTENPTWFTFSPPTATISFTNNNNNTTTQNFCIAANGVHDDVEVVVFPITPARPGFDAMYKIVYKNKGNQSLSGNLSFTFDDSVLDFVAATMAPSSQNVGLLNWSYINLMPFENRSFYVTFHVNAPTDTPPVNIGDILNFNTSITPVITDENPLDNSFSYNQTVVGSFDPNNITCLEGAIVPTSSIGSYLHYGVNFENTGTSQAQNIVVKVVIDATKYDVNSLQMLNTSNSAYTRITGNVVEFIFKNIMLDSGGHGNVLFKIRTKNNLVNGDIVSKNADIFFDYNAPINTGMANTTFQSLNNGQFILDNSIEVMPNPTSSISTVKSTNVIKSIEVYDVQGRLLETKLSNVMETTINLSEKENGVYFLKITTDVGRKVEKIVKE